MCVGGHLSSPPIHFANLIEIERDLPSFWIHWQAKHPTKAMPSPTHDPTPMTAFRALSTTPPRGEVGTNTPGACMTTLLLMSSLLPFPPFESEQVPTGFLPLCKIDTTYIILFLVKDFTNLCYNSWVMKKIPELVLPAGDLHRAKIAFLYGADAIYVGLDKYSLRKAEVRFSISEIKKAILYAHSIKKKIYVTFNIFAHNRHLKSIEKDMREIAKAKPDAFIISDPGVIEIAKRVAKGIPIHLSTQANTINSESVKFWLTQGIKRIVLAREATLTEIRVIKKTVPKMELEIFIHGAMCISYSGRCLLSSIMTNRSANLGECAQPCRWEYKLRSDQRPATRDQKKYFLEETKRPGEYYAIDEDSHGTYIMNSKDLCLIEHIDKILPYVDALKIEGRNKTDFYVATVARAYKNALATIDNKQLAISKNRKLIKELRKELDSLTHRDYTTGFLFNDAKKGETFPSRQPILGKKYLGFVESVKKGYAKVIVKNKLEVDKKYELLTPNEVIVFKITEIIDKDKKQFKTANPGRTGETVFLQTDKNLSKNSFIRELSR